MHFFCSIMQNLTLLSTWSTRLIVKELKNRKLLLVRFVYSFDGMDLLHIIKMTKNKSAIAIEAAKLPTKLPQNFGWVVRTYKWYFVIPGIQVKCWGHSEVVVITQPYLLLMNSFELFGGDTETCSWWCAHPNEPTSETFTTYYLFLWISEKMLQSEALDGVPLLLLANKQDLSVRKTICIYGINLILVSYNSVYTVWYSLWFDAIYRAACLYQILGRNLKRKLII